MLNEEGCPDGLKWFERVNYREAVSFTILIHEILMNLSYWQEICGWSKSKLVTNFLIQQKFE